MSSPDNISNDPDFYIARALLGLAYLEKGLFEEAITELKRTLTITDNSEVSALLGYAFAVSGRSDEARQTLEELQEAAQKRYVDPALIAVVHIGLKEKVKLLSIWKRLMKIDPYGLLCSTFPPSLRAYARPTFHKLTAAERTCGLNQQLRLTRMNYTASHGGMCKADQLETGVTL